MRCQSILALGEMKDADAVDTLIRVLEQEPPIPMKVPPANATQQQIMFVRYQQRRDVRAWSALALGLIQSRSAMPILLKTAEDPDDFFLRLSSVQALTAVNAREALPVLLRRLDDPLSEVRVAALQGLEKSEDRSVVDRVVARLSDQAVTVRAQAIRTLAELGDPRVRPQLEALRHTDPEPAIQNELDRALSRLAH
jgi:HEAT repeat protein